MHIDQSHEKVEVIDDIEITREEWEAYYIYMESLLTYMNKLKKSESLPEVKQSKAFIYKLIFRKALADSNRIYTDINPIKKFWIIQES